MNKAFAVFVTGFALIATCAAEAAPQGWLLPTRSSTAASACA
ncbi:MAG TPA: hypothetical protein VF432_01985 [Thermoanaerobaculia bacterium]